MPYNDTRPSLKGTIMFRKSIKYLFVPRTDSPTKAYYLGLFGGLYLAYTINEFLIERQEHKLWMETYDDERINAFANELNATIIEDTK